MRQTVRAFTLVEILIAISVLTLLILLLTGLLGSAANITTMSGKHMDSEGQIRPLLDRMASDFTQMCKRSDMDFYGKGTTAGGAMAGNDRLAFFAMTPGDYPSTGSQSPFSVIAYKVNSSTAAANSAVYTRLQRMARGLLMNGDSSANNGGSPSIVDGPILFTPIGISTVWSTVASSATTDSKYEITGPQVFRFEYYYLLTNGTFSITPWDSSLSGHIDASGMRDVAAIISAFATVDPKSRVLLTNSQVATIAGTLVDYSGGAGHGPGWLLDQWQSILDAPTNLAVQAMPRTALSGIRLYERYFYLAPAPQ